MNKRNPSAMISFALFGALLGAQESIAETFVFGFAANGLTTEAQKSSTALMVGDFTMQLAATGPAGAWLFESNGVPGLGIGSSPVVPGGEYEDFDKSSGVAEGIRFSFDRPGILTGLDFDGVKDENYEFMLLQTSTSADLYFFDSFEGSLADPGLIEMPGQVVFLNEFTPPDDGILDLAIPFAAGQEIWITYGDLPIGNPGNGARLQRILVAPVPEPGSMGLLLLGVIVLGLRKRSR